MTSESGPLPVFTKKVASEPSRMPVSLKLDAKPEPPWLDNLAVEGSRLRASVSAGSTPMVALGALSGVLGVL